jgi:hypothetical protein
VFGQWLAAAGDVNGDGYGDVLVQTSCDAPCNFGCARVYLGGPDGLATTPTALPEPGPTPDACAKGSLSFAPGADLDGDGYADLLVGAIGPGPATSVYTLAGGPLGLSSPPAASSLPIQPQWLNIAVLGDADGDGYLDLAIAPGVSCNGPTIRCVSVHAVDARGPRPEPWSTLEAPADGPFPAAASDVDGDGRGDLLLFNGGCGDLECGFSANVYPGGPSGFLASLAIGLENPGGGVGFSGRYGGSPGSVTGDVDGDGFADVVLLLEYGQPAGYLYRGSAAGVVPVALVIHP